MYLLYVDASGTPESTDHTTAYALAGLCAHERSWASLERNLRRLKVRYQRGNRPFELHAMDFCISITEQDDIPGFADMGADERFTAVESLRATKLAGYDAKKRSRKAKYFSRTRPFVHLTRAQRRTLLEEALDIVNSAKKVRLFAEVVDKEHRAHRGPEGIVADAFTQVVSRFDHFLRSINKGRRPEQQDRGLIVMDREPTHEGRYRDLVERFRMTGHPYGKLDYVIEAPFFVDSDLANVIQAVDLIAYVTRRHVESPDDPGRAADFHRIFSRFDRTRTQLHGARHHCAPGSCRCAICAARGHGP